MKKNKKEIYTISERVRKSEREQDNN